MLLRSLKSASLALLTTAAAALLAACGGGSSSGSSSEPPPPATTYTATTGVAQKGPLVAGSTVTVQELGLNLAPGGSAYAYATSTDLGVFAPTDKYLTPNVAVTATGNYADDVTGATSDGPVTLQSYADLSSPTTLNVNVLTTLTYARINRLVNQNGLTVAAARAQAETEVLAAFGIATATPVETFGTLDLAGTAGTLTAGDRMLAALSAVVVQGRASADVAALLASMQADIAANGAITNPDTRAALVASAQALNLNRVAANLGTLYAAGGANYTAAALEEWLDQDGDGSGAITLPADFAAAHAGASLVASSGALSVNGTAQASAVTLKAGDVVALAAPPAQADGALKVYLDAGTTHVARVIFVKGLTAIAITPTAALPRGLAQRFVATGTFADGSTANLSGAVTWASSAPAVADIDPASGLSDGLALGTTSISAQCGGVSGALSVPVSAASVQSIVIAPTTLETGVGITRSFVATGTFSDGTRQPVGDAATWSTSTSGIVTVTRGAVTGLAAGTTTITATLDGVSASATVDVTSNSWTASPQMLSERVGGHSATLLQDGRLLVAGGVDGTGGGTTKAELYDPVTRTWRAAASMTTMRTSHTATLLADGRVLVVGGSTVSTAAAQGYTNDASAEIYDPVASTWTAVATMSVARSHHSATLLQDGRVLVVGGENASYLPGATAETYDPVANTWTPTALPPLAARSQHTATLLANGQVLVAGGFDIRQGLFTPLQSSELFDPVSGTFASTAITTTTGSGPDAVTTTTPTTMAAPHAGQSATLLSDGRVLVAGGGSDMTELYDPATQTWTATGAMTATHTQHAAVLLADGRVLVVGGTLSALPSAEIFDPASGMWSPTAAMLAVPGNATATRLPDGSVLACGGVTTSPGPDCESYW